MNRKAQINNVFTILITLLIVATIAIISVRFINNLLDDKCTSDLLIFENTLRDAISAGNNYGTVEQKRIPTACKLYTLCLVDADAIGTSDFHANTSLPGHSLMQQSVREGVQSNLFSFDTDGAMKEHGYVQELDLINPDEPLCIRNKGGFFSLQLKGQASSTLVSQVS